MPAAMQQMLLRRLLIIWLLIVPVAGAWYSLYLSSEPIKLSVVPHVPVADMPIVVTSTLRGPETVGESLGYRFYVDGKLVADGKSDVEESGSKVLQYIRQPSIEQGERVSFAVQSESSGQVSQKIVSLPEYAPQIWSSFVSFATFSTSVTVSVTTSVISVVSMTYYGGAFGAEGLNLGLIIVSVLLGILVFLEISMPFAQGNRMVRAIGMLRVQYRGMAIVLSIIFVGMLLTRVLFAFGLMGMSP